MRSLRRSVIAAARRRRARRGRQQPVRTDSTARRQRPRHPAARGPGHRDPYRGAAVTGAVRDGRARPDGAPARAADRRHRRGAEQPARCGRQQPLQLLARPADLDPRVRQPVQLRRARAQDPARRHSPDPAGRPEPAHQHRLRRHRAGRGAQGRQLVALRQCVGWGDLVPERARGAGPVRAAGAGAGRQREADGDAFYKWQSWTSGRVRQRQRHPVASRSSRPTASGSTAPRSSASSTPGWTTP